MMIRSTPPASAHFAERPVPAPAPMIGLPLAVCARRRRRISSPGIRIALTLAGGRLEETYGGVRRVEPAVDLRLRALVLRAPQPPLGGHRRAVLAVERVHALDDDV